MYINVYQCIFNVYVFLANIVDFFSDFRCLGEGTGWPWSIGLATLGDGGDGAGPAAGRDLCGRHHALAAVAAEDEEVWLGAARHLAREATLVGLRREHLASAKAKPTKKKAAPSKRQGSFEHEKNKNQSTVKLPE